MARDHARKLAVQRAYRLRYAERIRAREREHYAANIDRIRSTERERRRADRKRDRITVLKHYSDNTLVCARCSYSNVDALDLDHIGDDGAAHRREVGSGSIFYRWLIANGLPAGLQVLCRNCNWLKELARRRAAYSHAA